MRTKTKVLVIDKKYDPSNDKPLEKVFNADIVYYKCTGGYQTIKNRISGDVNRKNEEYVANLKNNSKYTVETIK